MPKYALFSLLFLAACGGGSKSPSPAPLPLRDTTPPVIELAGTDPQVLTTGDAYSELGATATDNLDGDVSSSITIDTSAVDTSTAGDYIVTYAVADAAGNIATETRIVRVENPPPPSAPSVSLDASMKRLIFDWDSTPGATHYRFLENADGHSGFTQVGSDIPAGTFTFARDIAVHLFDFVNAQFIVEACNISGCTSSDVVFVHDVMLDTIGQFNVDVIVSFALSADGNTIAVGNTIEGGVYIYRQASDSWSQQAFIESPEPFDEFGFSVALSADGNTLAVGVTDAEAAYVFRFDGDEWLQQAHIKAPGKYSDHFGYDIALSADGSVLAVGTWSHGRGEDRAGSGSAYVFRFDGANWVQEEEIESPRLKSNDWFGMRLTLSGDGSTLAVGSPIEDGDPSDPDTSDSGAVDIFRYDGNGWSREAYIKASNADAEDIFGWNLALSEDGNTLAVGVPRESSNATGINGEQNNNLSSSSGAVYLFRFDENAWYQQAYIKPTNTTSNDRFGISLSLNADGNMLAVGASGEDSDATGVNGDQNNDAAPEAGATYLYTYDGITWSQTTYVKAPDTQPGYSFSRVALDGSGNVLVVGSRGANSVYIY